MGDFTYAECQKSHPHLGGKTDGCQEFTGSCEVCGCHLNFHRKVPPVVIYTKCQKTHDFKFQISVDGCQQFIPAGKSGKAALTCAVCGCHKGFHQWEVMKVKEEEEEEEVCPNFFLIFLKVWNCRGLGATSTVQKLGEWVREIKPVVLFLSETKCGNSKFEKVRDQLNMYGVCVPAVRKAGGLALMWRKDVLVQLSSYSKNHIDVDVLSEDTTANWRFTGIYGEADVTKRKEVWNRLVHLSKRSDAAWICAGDFNEILCTTEKTGTRRPQWQIDDFRNALAASDLTDLGFQGTKYTWCNRRQNPNTVWARLDRACGNTRWVSKWPNICVEHRGVPYSDHALLVISWNLDRGMSGRMRKQRFRFEAKWLQSEECNRVVEEAWSKPTPQIQISEYGKRFRNVGLVYLDGIGRYSLRQGEKLRHLRNASCNYSRVVWIVRRMRKWDESDRLSRIFEARK
ncbi:UNVERIFIED_CONTAM: hypothetical protein Sradi_2034800 [Sesamum radiatum]|uniref:ZF-HD dimerization-type domain-containing protein n=1 Tax=Sesamum radiatum TaxID=300843 RepID=A0AAW2TGM2_SESRA